MDSVKSEYDLVKSKFSEIMLCNKSDKCGENHFEKLPLEIITKIVSYLNIKDVLTLTSVSKIWRCKYLNQNIIWKSICQQLNLQYEDYSHCLATVARNNFDCKGYLELSSDILFGPHCKWWSIYCRYNMIIHNIKNNDFPTFNIKRLNVDQSFCTDDYIINIYYLNKKCIEAVILKDSKMPLQKKRLKVFDLFTKLLKNKSNTLKIVGNKRFLVFEIHSVIFVYSIVNGEFISKFQKVVKSCCVDYDHRNMDVPDNKFLNENNDTKIDIWDDKLALIHPHEYKIFLINLNKGKVIQEFIYNKTEKSSCIVDCIKCADKRLMIGLTTVDKYKDKTEFVGIVYQLEEVPNDNQLLIPVMNTITQFKVTKNYIGIQNKGPVIPIVKEVTGKMTVFWIECDTFSFDCTRNFIYYNVSQSIFQYDLNKSIIDKFEVTQKIAIDAISDLSNLTPINDRFLLVQSILPNAYSIFDVIDHVIVRSIQLTAGFTLCHVGKLSIVFSNSKEFLIVSFC